MEEVLLAYYAEFEPSFASMEKVCVLVSACARARSVFAIHAHERVLAAHCPHTLAVINKTVNL